MQKKSCDITIGAGNNQISRAEDILDFINEMLFLL